MLNELTHWALKYFDRLQDGESIPAPFVSIVDSMLHSTSHSWMHLGGVIDFGVLSTVAIPDTCTTQTVQNALFVAGEMSARIGASLLLASPQVRETASIVTLQVWFQGLMHLSMLEPSERLDLNRIWSHALKNAPLFGSLQGADRRQIWQTLNGWSLACLTVPVPHSVWDVPHLLTGVRLQLGSVWYWGTIRVLKSRAPASYLSATQAIEEILDRHIRAASKRLRYQQIERIVIAIPPVRTVLDSFVEVEQDAFKTWIARYILRYEWSEELENVEWLKEMEVALREVESKIDVHFDETFLIAQYASLVKALPHLFVGVSYAQLATVLDLPKRQVWRPNELEGALKACRNVTPVSQSGIDVAQWTIPTFVQLKTTRGGLWPERRQDLRFLAED